MCESMGAGGGVFTVMAISQSFNSKHWLKIIVKMTVSQYSGLRKVWEGTDPE